MQTEKEYMSAREVPGLRCESVGEYSLPDYNGDVRKVLTVKTRVFPSGKFVGDGTLEISGTVEYNVVYLDSENKPTHAEFSTDYDAALKINTESYVDSDVHTEVSSYSVRLVGPRKFSVKAILDTAVSVSERKTYTLGGDAFMEYEPEYLSDSIKVLSMDFAGADAREFEEEMLSLDGAIADEVEVLLCTADSMVRAEDVTEHSVTVKGDILVDLLYINGDSDPIRIRREIPYSEEVSLDSASDFEDVRARLEITTLKSSVTPTDDGVRILLNVSAAPRVCARKNTYLNLVSDAFLKERGTENEYADFGYTEYVCSESSEERREYKHSLSELDADGIKDVIYCDATVRTDAYETEDSTVRVSGEIRISAIAIQQNDDGAHICVPIKFSIPFEQNVNIGCQIYDNMHLNCHTRVNDIVLVVDADHIDASFTLATSVSAYADRRRRCLTSSYVTDEEYMRDASIVTVYYPDQNENLFEIARRFHTSVRSIAESNRLTETVFSSSAKSLGALGVGKLIIK